ncbi:MAG: UvrD-helicase domain-containing protein [Acidobacteriia bacterium]|nr:UvrD-helicase domain-containing protein [Terriglobia bacterium]
MKPIAYTPAQRRAMDAAQRGRDTCVVAGPGSGKTTVLVEYFMRLVAAGVDPLRILAITFTEKAAGHMREKLGAALREDPAQRARLERAWVSTVHGFCARLVRENAVFAGADPEFRVADERESLRMQQEAMAAAMDALFADRPAGVRALIRGLSSLEFEDAVRSAYDAMRGAGVSVEALARFPAPPGISRGDIARTLDALGRETPSNWSYAQKQHLAAIREGAARVIAADGPRAALQAIEDFPANLQKCKRGTRAYELVGQLREQIQAFRYASITAHHASEREMLIDVVRRFDRLYRERKRQAGALDFADLEEFAVRLLEEHPARRAHLQEQFDYILMDEFQDTNPQQGKLLGLVRRPDRFYAVGDINQSIFGFRHAEPQGFREYRDAVARRGGRLVELIDNFRSRPHILSAVETVVAGAAGVEPRSLVAGRKFEQPRPVSVEAIAAPQPADEASWVARRILDLRQDGGGFDFKDVAVLVRNTEVIPDFTAAFDQAGIPYLVNRGKGFYETREVNDLAHLLAAIANPRDEISLAAVLRSPLAGASDEALLRLKMLADNLGAALWRLGPETATGFDAADYQKLCRFRDRLREWRLRREYVSFDRLLLSAIDDCGYRPESGARVAANIDKFLAQAREASSRGSLDAFVEELALVRGSNPREPDAPPEDSANAVKVMTVHSAKGLEFPVVFVAALHKGVDSKPPVVAFSPRIGLGARWRNPVRREDKDDLFQHLIREERKRLEGEEANRLLYVAMTRAEQHLALSFSLNDKKPANWAELVTESLGLDLEQPRDEVVTRTAPDGKPWNLRLLVADRAADLSTGHPGAASLPVPESPEEVELLAPPEAAGQQEGNATVTALAHFANCPRRYFLGGYLGFEGRARGGEESAGDGELSASEFGTQVHALLAGAAVAQPDPEAVRLAETFRQSPLGRRLARASRVEREFDFLMAVDDLVVGGQVDLWFEEGGELVIVDYKTDSVNAAEAHRRALEYAWQLRLYALAVERVVGRAPDRAWLHFLRPNTAIAVDVAPSLLESPAELVRDFAGAQSKLAFPLNEGERCRRCEFFHGLCPSAFGQPRAPALTEPVE